MRISIATLGLILLVSGCNNTENLIDQKNESDAIKIPSNISSAATEKKEISANDTMEESAHRNAVYADYSEEEYEKLLGKEPFALFFHASWCPTCRQIENDILADISNYPEGTHFLKADYDKEIALKKKYLITTQSTVVIINGKGEVFKVLVAPDKNLLKETVKRSIE